MTVQISKQATDVAFWAGASWLSLLEMEKAQPIKTAHQKHYSRPEHYLFY